MKRVTVLCAALCALALQGCAGMKLLETGKVDPAMSQAQVKAQSAVNEARRILISADQLIGESVTTGIWTPDEAQKYLNTAKEYRLKLDQAQAILDKGDFTSAVNQANLTNTVADLLLKELLAAKAKGKPKPVGAIELDPLDLHGRGSATFYPEKPYRAPGGWLFAA